ncbi:hypothetical protein GCM10027294_26450 [Marinactinospora endophytica]
MEPADLARLLAAVDLCGLRPLGSTGDFVVVGLVTKGRAGDGMRPVGPARNGFIDLPAGVGARRSGPPPPGPAPLK